MSKPKRAHSIRIEAGADTQDDLVYALEQIIFDIRRGSRGSVSGGYSTNWIVEYEVDKAMTHDQYFALIDDYLRRYP